MVTKDKRPLGAALFSPRDGPFPAISPILPGPSALSCYRQKNPRDAPDDSARCFHKHHSLQFDRMRVKAHTEQWKDLAGF